MDEQQTARPEIQNGPEPESQESEFAPPLDLVAVKLTDVGRARPHNEDFVDYYVPSDPEQLTQKGAIYLVADGMGGHQAGEVASRRAVELVIGDYYSDTNVDVGSSLVLAFHSANQQLHALSQSDPSRSGMGTTLVAAVILGQHVYIANVGDSRAYLINQRRITQITLDHSWVEEQVRAGLITPEQARRHPQRNLVTRALGSRPSVEVDLFEGEIGEGDTLLLCSDGLTGRVEDREISTLVREHPPQDAARRLVSLANERGGNDNVTVLLVQAREEPTTIIAPALASFRKTSSPRSLLILALVVGAATVALLLGLLAWRLLFTGRAPETPPPSTPVPGATSVPGPAATASEDTVPTPIETLSPSLTDSPVPLTATLIPAPAAMPQAQPANVRTSPCIPGEPVPVSWVSKTAPDLPHVVSQVVDASPAAQNSMSEGEVT